MGKGLGVLQMQEVIAGNFCGGSVGPVGTAGVIAGPEDLHRKISAEGNGIKGRGKQTTTQPGIPAPAHALGTGFGGGDRQFEGSFLGKTGDDLLKSGSGYRKIGKPGMGFVGETVFYFLT